MHCILWILNRYHFIQKFTLKRLVLQLKSERKHHHVSVLKVIHIRISIFPALLFWGPKPLPAPQPLLPLLLGVRSPCALSQNRWKRPDLRGCSTLRLLASEDLVSTSDKVSRRPLVVVISWLMNEHLVHHAGALAHHLNPAAAAMAADLDPEHVETTEVLLSLLQQNKALSGNVVTFFEITTKYFWS